jgi:type IV pilus assembly protein PilM
MVDFSLKKYLDFSFFNSKDKSVVGVDIGSSAIKVVQLRKKHGVAVLETYGEIALGPYAGHEVGQAAKLSVEQIATSLTDVVRESGVTAHAAGFSIPFTSSLVTMIHLPHTDPKQLSKMIPYEARKYIPVPISEVSLDWFVVPQNKQEFLSTEEEETKEKGKTEVLLVAIHNDVLQKYHQIVDATSIKADFLEIEIFSSIRAALDKTLAPVVIVDMGAATTKLYVIELGVPKVSYLINRGGQDITQALSRSLGISMVRAEEMKREEGLIGEGLEENARDAMLLVLDHILSEANRVLLSYQKRYGKNVSKAVLTGGGAVLQGLLPVAKKHLETEVELSNSFSKIETPAFLEDVLTEVGPEFTVAIGLALRRLQESR